MPPPEPRPNPRNAGLNAPLAAGAGRNVRAVGRDPRADDQAAPPPPLPERADTVPHWFVGGTVFVWGLVLTCALLGVFDGAAGRSLPALGVLGLTVGWAAAVSLYVTRSVGAAPEQPAELDRAGRPLLGIAPPAAELVAVLAWGAVWLIVTRAGGDPGTPGRLLVVGAVSWVQPPLAAGVALTVAAADWVYAPPGGAAARVALTLLYAAVPALLLRLHADRLHAVARRRVVAVLDGVAREAERFRLTGRAVNPEETRPRTGVIDVHASAREVLELLRALTRSRSAVLFAPEDAPGTLYVLEAAGARDELKRRGVPADRALTKGVFDAPTPRRIGVIDWELRPPPWYDRRVDGVEAVMLAPAVDTAAQGEAPMLVVCERAGDPYTSDEAEAAAAAGRLLHRAFASARVTAGLIAHRDALDAVGRAVERVGAVQRLDEAAGTALAELTTLTGAAFGAFVWTDPRDPTRPLVYTHGIDRRALGDITAALGPGGHSRVRAALEAGGAAEVPDTTRDPEPFAVFAADEQLPPVRSLWMRPVRTGRRAWGTAVFAFGEPRGKSRAPAPLVEALLGLTAATVEAAFAADEIDRLNECDPLTGLLQRSTLERRLERRVRAGERAPKPYAVAVVDIDGMRLVNELHGTGVGDEVLRALAAELTRRFAGPGEWTARWGGDAAAIVFDASDPAAAEGRLRSLCDAVAARRYVGTTGEFRVTCSVGYAVYPAAGKTPGALWPRAEEALAAARNAGRGAVVGRPRSGGGV